jgi:uncharacterized C2H2 Zn-finger protein
MHKHCPFCKKEVQQDAAKCPHCGMTIRESFATAHHTNSSTSTHSNTTHKKPNLFKQAKEKVVAYLHRPKVYRAGHAKADVYKKWAVVVMVGLFAYGLYSSGSRTVAVNQNPIQSTNYVVPTLASTPQQPAVIVTSPNTGTIIKRDYDYLQGNGKLHISNGTNLDAVAKLVYADHSVFSVYIRAGGEYTISNVSDGYYRLMFALGNNWHSDSKMFALNSAYSKFDESFDFKTTSYEDDSYRHFRYTTFRVTLNPVMGGQATTASVNPAEFNNY